MSQNQTDDGFEAIWTNEISRRRLLRAAGLGAGAVLGGQLLAACSAPTPNTQADPSTSAEGSKTASDASDVVAASGGTLSVALADRFSELDPVTRPGLGNPTIYNLVYQPLYRVDPLPPRSKVIPELAVGMPEQVDATTYRVAIRQDALFHNGDKMTISDVIYSMNRLVNPDGPVALARFFDAFETVDVVDDGMMEIRLAHPITLLPERLALIWVMSQAAVEASEEALTLKPVGTGPYQMIDAVSGQTATLERFEDYTGDGEYNVEKVVIDVVADTNARLSGLKSGQYQVAVDVPASSLQALSTDSRLETAALPSDILTAFIFHCGKAPFDDPRVRQAVMYAIDRDTISETVFRGHALPGWDGLFHPDAPGYTAADFSYAYDPAKAQQLLREAGLGDSGIPIDLLVANIEFISSQASIVEQNLRDVGFEPNVIPGETLAHYGRINDGDYSAFLTYDDTAPIHHPDVYFSLKMFADPGFLEGSARWTDAARQENDRLVALADGASSDEERIEVLAELQNLWHREGPIQTLHFKEQLSAWSADLIGFEPLSTPYVKVSGLSISA